MTVRLSDHDYNRLRVLRHIRRQGSASRVEIVGATGLAKGTVTELTGDLVRRGVLVEEPGQAGERGRPRVKLRIDAQAGYAVSFFPMMDGTASVDIIDLQAERVFSRTVRYSVPEAISGFIPQVADAILETIALAPVAHDTIRHAGIVVPGSSTAGTA